MTPEFKEQLRQDSLLRREAGEGWHENGLNESLLGMIVRREVLVEDIVENRANTVGSSYHKRYRDVSDQVQNYKQEHGISDPPPLPPEED